MDIFFVSQNLSESKTSPQIVSTYKLTVIAVAISDSLSTFTRANTESPSSRIHTRCQPSDSVLLELSDSPEPDKILDIPPDQLQEMSHAS